MYETVSFVIKFLLKATSLCETTYQPSSAIRFSKFCHIYLNEIDFHVKIYSKARQFFPVRDPS